jgi:hypothetical protein
VPQRAYPHSIASSAITASSAHTACSESSNSRRASLTPSVRASASISGLKPGRTKPPFRLLAPHPIV